MGANRRRKVKIKYKNVALLLAAILIFILIVVWTTSPDKTDDDNNNDNIINDQPGNNVELPEQEESPDEVKMTTDPTLQTSYYFMPLTLTEEHLGMGELVLVNNNIKYLGSVNEDELVCVRETKNQSYKVKDYSVLVRKTTIDALNEMMLGFYSATQDNDVMVISGYRTVEYQQKLYDDELASTGLSTSSLVSRAGYSEHHTGYVIDFKLYHDNGTSEEFDGQGVYSWIMENCHKYGFINRYPSGKEKITFIDNEPWHFRYVGKVHAGIITEYDFCLEEYIDFLKNYTMDTGFLKTTTDDGKTYIIYYVPMVDPANTTVYIPLISDTQTPYPYEISGNNMDGWIVTVDVTDFNSTNVPLTPNVSQPDNTESGE